jgi:hypothetical protein
MNRKAALLSTLSTMAFATFAMTGCDSSADTSPQAAPTDRPSATTPSETPASVASTPAPAKSTTTTTAVAVTKSPVAGGGCPVGAATLITARKRNTELDKAILETRSLSEIDCYRGYAVAISHPVQTQADNAVLVFEYSGGAWSAVNGGTADFCDGVVPAGVRKELELCR